MLPQGYGGNYAPLGRKTRVFKTAPDGDMDHLQRHPRWIHPTTRPSRPTYLWGLALRGSPLPSMSYEGALTRDDEVCTDADVQPNKQKKKTLHRWWELGRVCLFLASECRKTTVGGLTLLHGLTHRWGWFSPSSTKSACDSQVCSTSKCFFWLAAKTRPDWNLMALL